MSKELLYFTAVEETHYTFIRVVAATRDMAMEIAQYYYKDKFKFKLYAINDYRLSEEIAGIFTPYNISQGYHIYGARKPVEYFTRNELLDEILIDL